MANFSFLFWASLALCASVTFRSSEFYKQKFEHKNTSGDDGLSDEVKKVHASLLKKYLFVYLMATLSDWLQGPYVYACTANTDLPSTTLRSCLWQALDRA